MSRKKLLFTLFAVSFLLPSALPAADAGTRSGERSVVQAAEGASHAGSTNLPAGWFGSKRRPAVLTATKAEPIQPAAHFDVEEPASPAAAKGQSVVDRLRKARAPQLAPRSGGNVLRSNEPNRETPPIRVEQRPVDLEVLTTSRPIRPGARSSSKEASSAVDAPAADSDNPPPAETHSSGAFTQRADSPERRLTLAEPTDRQQPAEAGTSRSDQARGEAEQNAPMVLDSDQRPGLMRQAAEAANEPTVLPQAAPAPTAGAKPAVESHQAGAERVFLIENESPLIAVRTRGPRTIVVGKPSSYVVELSNESHAAAEEVVVKIDIPSWVEVIRQEPSSGGIRVDADDQGDGKMIWTVGRLEGEAREQLLLNIVPRGSRPLDLAITWTFTPVRSTAVIQVQEPKLELDVIGPQDVLYGETKVYTITISNPGTGEAENVLLKLLPLVSNGKAAGARRLGNIPAGERRTIEVELTARQTGRLQVRAEAVADGGLDARGAQEVLVRRAVLEVQVDGPPMKYAGTRARYAVRVSNSGDATARDVVATATLPAGAGEVATSDGGTLEPEQGQVRWHLGTLRPGAARVLELECALMSPGANRLDVQAVAAQELNALGSVVTNVESLADLKLTVNDPKGAVAVGDDVVYEVRIVNRGTKAAENVNLYGFFSEGIEPVAVRGWRGQLGEGEVILERIPRLAPGQEMVIKISARAERRGDHVFRAELECNNPETKLAVEEWTRFYGEASPVRQAERPAR